MPLVKLAEVHELMPGCGKVVAADGREVALFNVSQRFYAIANTCPHSGGPLGEGVLDGVVVECPWHRWKFDVTTGACGTNPAVRVATVKTVVQEGNVLGEI